jgi:hypothetical protein
MPNRRGEVWWGPAPHKSSPSYRPWLIVSDDSPPFADEEEIVPALTTRTHHAGIAVSDDGWVRGGSMKDAFVSPWYVTTMKYRDLEEQQGVLGPNLVAEAVDELHRYVPSQVTD